MSSADDQEQPVSLAPAEIKQVLDALAASDWDEAVVTVGDVTISVARNGARLGSAPVTAASAPAAPAPAPPAAAAAPAPAAAPVAAPASAPVVNGLTVAAPSVGVFWRSPQPGAPSFVEVGTHVNAGDTLAIVEVMKLMNNITAPVAGTVAAVCVENAAHVEHGDALMVLTPDEG